MNKMNYLEAVKYPKTPHFDFSKSLQNDDRMLMTMEAFKHADRVIVTEKLDGENCLEGETIITTNVGDIKIKDICENKIKCKILSYNVFSNELEYNSISNYFVYSENDNDEWYEIELDDNIIITITGNHKVWLPKLNCYRRVCDLKENDILYRKD